MYENRVCSRRRLERRWQLIERMPPKPKQQRISSLPKPDQRAVMRVLDSMLAQAGRQEILP